MSWFRADGRYAGNVARLSSKSIFYLVLKTLQLTEFYTFTLFLLWIMLNMSHILINNVLKSFLRINFLIMILPMFQTRTHAALMIPLTD